MAMPIQVGDVVALANMCYAIAQAFGSGRKAAPVEFREVQNELYGLGQMLDLLRNSVESGVITTSSVGPSPTSQASQCIARMVANCQNTVDSLKDFAVKYAPLAGLEFIEARSGVTVKRAPSTSKQKLKRNWKRLMWTTEVGTIQGIRDQISIHVQSITAVVSLVNTHTTIDLRNDVRTLTWQGEAQRLDLQAARADIYHVQMGVSMAEANIHHHVSSDIQMVRQDIQSLNHKLETIMAWQQRDMTSDVFNKQISQLLVKIEQLERLPRFAQPSAGLPYPVHDGYLAMPTPYVTATTDFYASANASTPDFSGHRRTSSRSRTDPVTTEATTESYQEVQLQVSVVNTTPVEIGLSHGPVDLQNLPPRGSRETATDVVFELCVQSQTADGKKEFTTVCAHACFHGNWIKAVEDGEHNEGLFACLCEPYQHEDEDFEPHAQDLEKYILTSSTIGCHYHGPVQWILHNVGDQEQRPRKAVTLGIRNLGTQKELQFERTFIEPISFKTAKAVLQANIGSFLTYKVPDAEEGDQLAILNSMADDSFSSGLERISFTLGDESTTTRQTLERKVKHTNILHYKSISINEIERSRTLKRDSFKYFDYVEILVGVAPVGDNEYLTSFIKMHLDEICLDSNDSQDDCIVQLSMIRGEATFPMREKPEQNICGFTEFKFKTPAAANDFLQRLREMKNELHALKIQHAKRHEQVMVKMFAEQIAAAAADDIQMSGVEIAVVWDERRKKGRILARSQDGTCFLSQTLHLDIFERFAELSRGDLFNGSAEVYQPAARRRGDRVKKYPSGVGRIQFKDSSMDDMFYARLTESARRMGFSMSEPKTVSEEKRPKDRKSDERPILQRRVTQLERSKSYRFSKEHYQRIVTETVAIEEASAEMIAALPKQNLSRPLDAEELLDLLNQTEEKLIYTMEGADAFESVAPSQPSRWTSDDLTVRKRDRKKAGLTRPEGSEDEENDQEDAQGEPAYNISQFEARKVPQTAQTTPGLLSPQPETQNLLRKHRHGAGGIHLRAQNNQHHQRSQSTGGPNTQQEMPNSAPDAGKSRGISITPTENISDTRDVVGSPETYNESQDSLASVATTISVTEDRRTATPPRATASQERGTSSVSGTVQEHSEGPGRTRPTENIDPYAAELGLKFRVMTPKSFTRAYWLLTDVGDKLPKGTLVWVDESAAKPFMDGEHRINVTRYTGEPSAWVSKSVLKPGRYYAMKQRQRMVADGDTVKLARDQIVVPLEDNGGASSDDLELKVVPLEAKWSVVVEKDWVREVNLLLPMPPALIALQGSAAMTDEDKLCDQVKAVAQDNAAMLGNAASGTSTGGKQAPVHNDKEPKEEKALPKLSSAEFREYNRIAVLMNQYHNHFRNTWNEILAGVKTSRPKNQTLRQFLSLAQAFCRMLETHHNIEETYVFPILAKKMPAFQKNNKEHGEMIAQHQQIHKGLDKFSEYVDSVRAGQRDFVASEMLEIMESFEKVLWQHLDEEVVQLGAENMRKYWTLDELQLLPM
ncbi:hypothetical protein Dda_5898 [Drechslerella dactyloides]|uniref:Hemerythrin-like domain-containing protein n=1 Tax=Drechslerella dactyloides TaxID=74499 RepID=A0AAD6IUW2_DREDA|nr:hypothetical protein Dda_5898 [Drechslerella dactyloides]